MGHQRAEVSRRAFLGSAAGVMILAPQTVRGYQANSAVRVGLLGCGGRGTAVATSMAENAGARIAGLADLWQERVRKLKENFPAAGATFHGPRAAEEIANAKDLDAIIVATPPYFHPQHLDIVVRAGRHVYLEKPVAVDVAGAKRVLEIAKRADGKLSLEVGFQIRSAPPFVELVRRIHAGDLGQIASGEAHYWCPLVGDPNAERSTSQGRLRNWIFDRVLSGDIIVEQNIHAIDICNWVLKGHPLRATGVGSRVGRPPGTDCYGQCSVNFAYPNGVHVAFSSKQFGKGGFDVNERFFGTLGSSQSPYGGPLGIDGEKEWTWSGPQTKPSGEFSASGTFDDNLAQADSEKHKSFIASITSGKFHNQAEPGVESSLSAMLGRMAMDRKREVTWEELLASNESWDAKIDVSRLG